MNVFGSNVFEDVITAEPARCWLRTTVYLENVRIEESSFVKL